ncbi:MAG: TolC family protein [Bacteroidota bacterium]
MKRGWILIALLGISLGVAGQTLAELEQMALSAPQVRVAEQEVDVRLAEAAQTSRWGNLQVAGSAFASPIQTRTGRQVANFSLMQPLPWLGEQRAKQASAMGQVSVAQVEVSLSRTGQVYQVRLSWLDLFDWQQTLKARQAKVENLRVWEGLLEGRYRAGEIPLSEVVALQTQLRMAEGRLSLWKLEENPLKAQLEQVVGKSLPNFTMPDSLSKVSTALGPGAVWEETLWFQKGAEERKALEAEEQVVLWHNRPQLSVGTQYGIIVPYAEGPEVDNGRDIWMLPQLKVSVPVSFQATKQELKALEARQLQVSSSYEAQEWAWKTQWAQVREIYQQGAVQMQEAVALLQLLDQQQQLLTAALQQDQGAAVSLLQVEEARIEARLQYQLGLTAQWRASWFAEYLLAGSSQEGGEK